MVNGRIDQKAYLLVPKLHATIATEQLRQYRLRINPIGRREARFRDSLTGLPSVIHIDTSTQQNLDLLANMSAMNIWKSAPESVRGISKLEGNTNLSRNGKGPRQLDSTWKSNHNEDRHKGGNVPMTQLEESFPKPSRLETDDTTALTQSVTQSVATPSILSTATSKRLNELEAMIRQQQSDSADNVKSNQQMANQLEHIDAKLGRIDDMDTLLHKTIAHLNDNSEKLLVTMERQQDSHVQILELSIRTSRLTDVIDRMASRIESLTTALFKDNINDHDQTASAREETNHNDGCRRRRSIDEMKASEVFLHKTDDTYHTLESNGRPTTNKSTDRTQTKRNVKSPSKKKSRSLHNEL